MTLPGITSTELDGALGAVPTGSRILAILGVSSSGPINTPAAYGNKIALANDFGVGPLVELAARALDAGVIALVCRSGQSTDGAMGSIDDSHVTGTAVTFITHTSATKPLDDYQVVVKVITGGTLGVAGITYQVSLDGGRTFGPTTALGTGLIIAPANTGVSFSITTAKTLIAGDYWTATTTAPAPNAADVTAGLTPLRNTSVRWNDGALAFPLDATIFDAAQTAVAAMSLTKPKFVMGGFRMPTDGESESSYKTAFDTAFGAKATTVIQVCAGAMQLSSSVSGRDYRRPVVFHVAPLQASVAEHINIADVNLGAANGVDLNDVNGNPVYHDESINPGLDDSRACTLRTWDGEIQGVYVTRPRILCADGSDFSIAPLRRVMNIARIAHRAFLIRRLNQGILLDKKTGFILESEAREIEAGAAAAVKAVLGDAPKASAWRSVVKRDDNILSTKTMHVDMRIVPLGYVEEIVETDAFENPALAA